MARRAFVSRFSPNRTDPEVLEAIFVQRHHLAEVWLERLRDSVLTGARHHLLAVGPRGCGKSHLVVLLLHRLRQDPAINEQARIAWLPEDETTPSFWKFLLRILRALEATYGDEFPPPPRERLARATDADRSAVLTDYLLEKLDGRVLLVVVENLDDVMRGLGMEGQKRWRAFLQEHRVAATLATAQQLTKDLSDRDKPFFNFFQIERLQPLSADEALSLLRRLADQSGNGELARYLQSTAGRARIRAIRHLTGGSHRIFIILSEFATRENLDDLVSAFEELLDELTPYYQERLRWLPDQQREIVEFLCRQSQTVTVKKIAAELFLSEQAAAAQLKGLRDKGYVTAASVGRESRYELAEPLMRMCVEVKDPKREPIRLIVQFLRVWYDLGAVETRLDGLSPDADLERRYFHAVLVAYDPWEPDPLQAALKRDLELARASGNTEELVRLLVEQGATTSSVQGCVNAATELFDLGRYAEALPIYDRALELNANHAVAWNNKGATLAALGLFSEALAAIEHSLQLDLGNAVSRANKGQVLANLGHFSAALPHFDKALQLDSGDANIWVAKGRALVRLGRFVESLPAFDHALQLDPDNLHASDENGIALNQLGRYEDTLTICTGEGAFGYRNRGYARLKLGHLDGAREDFVKAINRCSDLPSALEGLAEVSLLQGDWGEARRFLSERFRLPSFGSGRSCWNLPGFLISLFHSSSDCGQRILWVNGIIEIVLDVRAYWEEKRAAEKSEVDTGMNGGGTWLDPLTALGNALVRSMLWPAYIQASTNDLDGWLQVWQKAAEREPDLAVSVRLFGVGLRYVQTKDERVLLDLVQEERSILRELFGLEEANE